MKLCFRKNNPKVDYRNKTLKFSELKKQIKGDAPESFTMDDLISISEKMQLAMKNINRASMYLKSSHSKLSRIIVNNGNIDLALSELERALGPITANLDSAKDLIEECDEQVYN